MSTNLKALTLAEVVALGGAITGRPCSERRVRYLLIEGALGTDTARRARGRTRLYNTLDVALVRLALALEAEQVSPQLTRIVLTYLRDDIVRAWKSAAPLGVAIRGVQATLEPATKGRPPWARVWVPLRDAWRGLDTDVQRVCDGRSDVWMYRPVKVRDVPRNTIG